MAPPPCHGRGPVLGIPFLPQFSCPSAAQKVREFTGSPSLRCSALANCRGTAPVVSSAFSFRPAIRRKAAGIGPLAKYTGQVHTPLQQEAETPENPKLGRRSVQVLSWAPVHSQVVDLA